MVGERLGWQGAGVWDGGGDCCGVFGMAGGEVQVGGKYPVFILVGAADKIHLQRKSRSYKM